MYSTNLLILLFAVTISRSLLKDDKQIVIDRENEFRDAVILGRLYDVERHMRDGVNVSLLIGNGEQAIHVATRKNYADVVQLLINFGADVNTLGGSEALSPLFLAVKQGFDGLVRILLQNGAVTNFREASSGNTPLHIAAANGNELIALKLLKSNAALVNITNNDGSSPLFVALKKGHVHIAGLLRNSGSKWDLPEEYNDIKETILKCVDKHAAKRIIVKLTDGAQFEEKWRKRLHRNLDRKNMLSAVIGNSDYEILKPCALLSTIEVDFDDHKGISSLLIAHKKDFREIAVLIENHPDRAKQTTLELRCAAQSDLNSIEEEGVLGKSIEKGHLNEIVMLHQNCVHLKTLKEHLFEAARKGYLNVVKYLVEEKGMDVNVRDNNGSTVLHWASENGNLGLVKYLIGEKGMNVNVKNNIGKTALHWASWNGQLDVVKYLVEENGMDVNAKNNEGNTALHLASWNGQLDVVKYLVEENGMDLNAKDDYGRTALHLACYNGKLDVVKYLVEEKGMDVNGKDNDRITALHYASCNGKLDVVKYLIEEKGMDVNAKDDFGYNALHLASQNGQLNVVEYLVQEKKMDVNSRTIRGESPLDLALKREQTAVAELLKNAGGKAFTELDVSQLNY